MQRIKKICAYSFTVIGSVIGAGFISGREILSFFSGCSLWSAAVFCAVFFFIFLYFSFLSSDEIYDKVRAVYLPILLVSNLIILSGMVSALNVIFKEITKMEFCDIFSIIALILSYFTIRHGIENFIKLSSFFIPLIFLFVIILYIFYGTGAQVFSTKTKFVKYASYAGLNIFLSNSLLRKIGKSATKREAVIISVITTVILVVLMCAIFLSLNASPYLSLAKMPTLTLVNDNVFLKTFYFFVSSIAIVSTLLSSHFTLVDFFNGFKHKKIANALIIIVAFAISKLGFYNIIDKIYPILGLIGAFFLTITYTLSKVFPKGRRSNTLPQTVRTT